MNTGTIACEDDLLEPLKELAGVVYETAREAAEAIVRALGSMASFTWSNAGETAAWDLFFTNTNFAQAPLLQGSAAAGSYYIALHTASPGQAGTQSTNESAYPGYARVGVARTVGGWTVTGNNPVTAENAAAVTFPASTGGPEVQAWFSLGSLSSGAGVVYGFGAISSPLTVNNGITPSFAIGALQNNLS